MFNLVEETVVKNIPGRTKRGSGGWLQFDAPCCIHNNESADHRSRGNLLISGDGSIVYNCYNCKFKTGWRYGNKFLGRKFKELLSWLGTPEEEIKFLETKTRIEFQDYDISEYKPEIKRLSFEERSLPDNSYNITELLYNEKLIEDIDGNDYRDMLNYLMSRGDHLSSLDNYYWSPSKIHGMNRRLIIPFYWENKLVGYTSRSFDLKPKYRYFSSMQTNYIFNTEVIKPHHKYIFVVEGAFDALAINGVAMLGDKCSDSQAYWLNQKCKYENKEIIVIPDQEKEGGQLLKIAQKNDWYVSFPKWDGCKDAAEATKLYGYVPTVQSILSRKFNSEYTIDAMKKILIK